MYSVGRSIGTGQESPTHGQENVIICFIICPIMVLKYDGNLITLEQKFILWS